MSNPVIEPDNLEKIARALEESSCGWLLEEAPNNDALLRQVAQEIKEFVGEYGRRFGDEPRPDPFALLDANREKGAAFFQTLAGAPITAEMRVMAWRVIMGEPIQSVEFSYKNQGETKIRIALGSGRSDPKVYESKNLWDFQALQHIGLLSVDREPILDGYYATL